MPVLRGENPIMQGMSGKFGDHFVLRNYGGQIRMSQYPNMKKAIKNSTPKQIRTREIMEEAVIMTRTVMFHEDRRHAAQIRLNVPSNKLYHALKKEFLAELYQQEREKNAIPVNETEVKILPPAISPSSTDPAI